MSLSNWVQRMNLFCEPPYRIGLMGSMFFAGNTCVGFFVSRAGDIYGRKWPTRISSLLSIPIQAAIIFQHNFTFRIILFFLQGMCAPGRLRLHLYIFRSWSP
jgi:MFS family permease